MPNEEITGPFITSEILINNHLYKFVGSDNALMGFGITTCSNPANVQNKTANLPNFRLKDGGVCSVVFPKGNTADSITLNINDTGDIPVYYKGQPIDAYDRPFREGEVATLIYSDGKYTLLTTDTPDFGPTGP